ncbi:MAG TPA: hypothetical protein VK137_00125 [Planctomycetaceae bacterium]|nr:hypothetical protein [Planctomycetaceae bacterium]
MSLNNSDLHLGQLEMETLMIQRDRPSSDGLLFLDNLETRGAAAKQLRSGRPEKRQQPL